MTYFLGLTLLAYLLGSIPFGLVVSRLLGGPDPRVLGSGNLGTANLYRVLGLKAAILTFLGDTLKGTLPVLLAGFWLAPLGAWREGAVAVVGGAAVLGHVFPVYLKFKGGKGVATAFGVVAALAPWAAVNLALVYVLALAQTRIFSLSALICAWLLPLAMGLFSDSKAYLLLAGFLSGLVLVCHRENLERLFKGEEPRI
ncbi:MAG: glycerol-3-phosphate 1-O-acyltransferase PlsY [Deltaproteobacteria bacterium]|nr:glycerol-3-phosphate 1-O-acyltransferase PlsY [Deltaproteobacteria bacterium]